MNSNYSLRPEDFRFAWANAYQRALVQVAEMQRDSDRQLNAVKDLLEVSAQQTEFGRTNLERSARVLVEMMRAMSIESASRIDEANRRLEEGANRLLARERQLLTETVQLVRQLAQDRQKLEIERAAIRDRSIWVRIGNLFKQWG